MIKDITDFLVDNPKAIEIILTIGVLIFGWRVVMWLDRNVFNKNRYK